MKSVASEGSGFDPVAGHGMQMLNMKNALRRRFDEEQQLDQICRLWSTSKADNRLPAVDVRSKMFSLDVAQVFILELFHLGTFIETNDK